MIKKSQELNWAYSYGKPESDHEVRVEKGLYRFILLKN